MKKQKINSRIINAAEALGWTVREDDDGAAEFAQYSPAGEDFSFTVNADDAAREVRRYADDFDPEDHVEMWIRAKENGVGGVPSLYELCEDADEIKKMLDELANAVGPRCRPVRRGKVWSLASWIENGGSFSDLDDAPSFSASGSVAGMRKKFYGYECDLVKFGGYIYKVN